MPDSQLINYLLFAALTAYVLADGWAQGGITLRNRQYIPPTEQPAINADLHGWLPLCYTLTCCCAAAASHEWRWLPIGLLLRLGLFDIILNRRKGDPLFAVGYSAQLDKALRKIAGTRADLLSAALRLSAAAAALVALWWLP